MITVLDLGNNNVKGINDKGTLINFRSNLSKSYESYPDGFNYILLDGNTIITPLSHNDNSMTNVLPYNDNCIINQLSSNDNTITTQLSHDGNSKFQIDLNKVSDADVEINASVSEDPNKNALDFLKSFGGD